MRMVRASLAVVTLAVLGGLVPRLAVAAPSVPTVVVLPVRGQEVRDRAILAAVEAQLAGLDVKVRTVWTEPDTGDRLVLARRAAGAVGAVAAVWWVDAAPRGLVLHVAVMDGSRLIVREVPGAGGAERHEALAVILRAAVGALLEPAPGPVRRPPRRRVEPPARPRRRVPSVPPRRHGLLIAWGLEGLDSRSLGHGLLLGYRVQVHRHLALRASYQVAVPSEREAAGSRARFWPHPLGVAVEAFTVRGRWLIGGAAGLELRVLHVHALPTSGADALPDDRRDAGLSATASLLAGVRLHPRLWLALEVGARFELLRHRYVAGTPPVALLAPWPVHPSALLGLIVGLR